MDLYQDPVVSNIIAAAVLNAGHAAMRLLRRPNDEPSPAAVPQARAASTVADATEWVFRLAERARPASKGALDPSVAAFALSAELAEVVEQLLVHRVLDSETPAFERTAIEQLEQVLALYEVGADLPLSAAELYAGLKGYIRRLCADAPPSSDDVKDLFQRQLLQQLDALRTSAEGISRLRADGVGAGELAAFEHALRRVQHETHASVSLRFTGAARSVPLEALYVEPRFRVEVTVPDPADASEPSLDSKVFSVDQPAGERGHRKLGFNAPGATIVGISGLYGLTDRVVVLGQPGGGKTTLTSRLCFDALDEDRPVPLVVTLRSFALTLEQDDPPSIAEYLARQCTTHQQIPGDHRLVVAHLLQTGRIHVIFDGLDEIFDPQLYERTMSAIEAFAAVARQCPVTVTSRPVGYDRGRLRGFVVADLQKFDHAEVEDYVSRYFKIEDALTQDERAEAPAAFLSSTGAAQDLRSVPLMLAIMCFVYATDADIPDSMVGLYQRCAKLYFLDWDAKRKIRNELGLPEAVMFEAFASLAATVFEDAELSSSGVTKSRLQTVFDEYFQQHAVVLSEDRAAVARALADHVTGRAWMLDVAGRDANRQQLFQFVHRTFLEYFAADHLAVLPLPSGPEPEGERTIDAELVRVCLQQTASVVPLLALDIFRRRHGSTPANRLAGRLVEHARTRSVADRLVLCRLLVDGMGSLSLGQDVLEDVVDLAVVGAVKAAAAAHQTYALNGYHSTDLVFEGFESLALFQASGYPFDMGAPAELISALLTARVASRAMVFGAVEATLLRLIGDGDEIAAQLAMDLFRLTGADADANRAARSVGRSVWSSEAMVALRRRSAPPQFRLGRLFCLIDAVWTGAMSMGDLLQETSLWALCLRGGTVWAPDHPSLAIAMTMRCGEGDYPSERERELLVDLWSCLRDRAPEDLLGPPLPGLRTRPLRVYSPEPSLESLGLAEQRAFGLLCALNAAADTWTGHSMQPRSDDAQWWDPLADPDTATDLLLHPDGDGTAPHPFDGLGPEVRTIGERLAAACARPDYLIIEAPERLKAPNLEELLAWREVDPTPPVLHSDPEPANLGARLRLLLDRGRTAWDARR